MIAQRSFPNHQAQSLHVEQPLRPCLVLLGSRDLEREASSIEVLTFGQKCPSIESLKGSELVRKVHKVARTRGVFAQFVPERGKGSHGTLHFGDRRTTVPNLKRELKSGTCQAILKQLGLTTKDLE